MSNWNKRRGDKEIPWILVIIGFSVLPPLGVFLLMMKLIEISENPTPKQREWKQRSQEWFEEAERGFDSLRDEFNQRGYTSNTVRRTGSTANNTNLHGTVYGSSQKTVQGSYHAPQQHSRTGAEQGRMSAADPRADWKPIKGAKWAIFTGLAIAAIFGIGMVDEIGSWLHNFSSLEDVFAVTLFCCGGLGLSAWGVFKTRQAQRFRKLKNLIGDHKLVDIHAIASAFPCSYEQACNMLEKMAYGGHLGRRAYVDSAAGQLVLTGEGVRERKEQEHQVKRDATVKQAEEELSILKEIRQVNDAIPDPELTRKIYRIEEITGHILEYQKKHPDKSHELRNFLNYYLPTTLKILNSYAEMDRQGVSGENISATKERVENMMDMVVEGFETQLDNLFRDEMMDIASDISVMEKMMGRDGLTENEMTMPKVEEAAEEPLPRPQGIHLTLEPEMPDGSAAQAAHAPEAWESGFYHRKKDEL